MKARGRKQVSLSCSTPAGRAAEHPASRRTTPSTGASTNRPIDAMIPWAPGASDHEVDRVFFRGRDMRPNSRCSTGRPDAGRAGRAKQLGAWTATRRCAVSLALVSWLAVLGCQTARPPTPVTSPTSTPPEAFPLAGMVWRADEIDGQRVVDGIASTIAFDGRSQAVGSTGCNRYVAPLQIAGSTLRLGDIALTRRACPPGVMDQERRFVVALGAIRTYHQEGDTLWFLDETGHVRLRLVRTQASASVRANPDKERRARDRGLGDGAARAHLRESGGRPEQEVVGSRARRPARQGGKGSWTAG